MTFRRTRPAEYPMEMRIVYDDQIFGWQQYGGISRYVVELARELSVMDSIDVSVVAPFHFNDYLNAASGTVKVLGRYVDVPVGFRRLIRRVNPLAARLAIGRSDADIVHETYYFNLRSAAPKAKTVVTVHDMVHEKFPKYFAASNTTPRLKAEAVKRADHVICVSEHTRKDLLELVDIDPAKTSVVHHGFTLGPSASNVLTDPYSVGAPYMLYVGSREGYKNFTDLVRAYASSTVLRAEFKLVCFGGGRFTADEKALIASLGLSDSKIRQLSGDDAALAACYKGAAALVYPSKYEGFGIPPLEAMSLNCPVVCSAISSIPEVVGEAAEYFSPHDLDSMREAIHRVVLSETRGQELIALGQERLKRFSWGKCARETLNIYRALSGT